MEYEGKAYCEEDFAKVFAAKCDQCHHAIVGTYVDVLGKKYHQTCFKCSVSFYFMDH